MFQPSRYFQIFHPHAAARSALVDRFAYYTKAETALSVIENETIWMRKTTCMNDYRELTFGLECLNDQLAFNAAPLREILDSVFPGLAEDVISSFHDGSKLMIDKTYIACVSEHGSDEDDYGRLSMWRAYGGATGVAIIFKKQAAQLHGLPFFSSPVLYTTRETFGVYFDTVVASLSAERDSLGGYGRAQLKEILLFVLRSALVSIKHKGFSEEKEWRIVYAEQFMASSPLTPVIRTINGVPQTVHEISLKRGQSGHSLIDLIDRVIVGPTQYPQEIAEAIRLKLKAMGMLDADARVILSDIPLRHNA